MLKWAKNDTHAEELADENKDFLVLFFWGSFSKAAERALGELKLFCGDYKQIPVCAVDVEKVKGIHKKYGVENVPTLIVIRNGKEKDRIEGVESSAYYAMRLAGAAPTHMARPPKKKKLSVTVYTSPGCAPCAQVKRFLKEKGVSFRSVDISRDEKAATEIMRRSGQQAVPQIDINGQITVGFDKNRLSALLGIPGSA